MTLLARQASVRRTLCSETESHDLDGVAEVAAAANSIDANQGFDRAGALHYVRTVKESGLDFFEQPRRVRASQRWLGPGNTRLNRTQARAAKPAPTIDDLKPRPLWRGFFWRRRGFPPVSTA